MEKKSGKLNLFKIGLYMNNKIELTEEELQMIYAGLIMYGNNLMDKCNDISCEDNIVDLLSIRSKQYYRLARKITDYMKGRTNQ